MEKAVKDVRISTRVTQSFKDRFAEKAKEIGLNEAKVLTALAEKFLSGEIVVNADEVSRVERLETELQLIKRRLEQIEEARKGELVASATI